MSLIGLSDVSNMSPYKKAHNKCMSFISIEIGVCTYI